MCPREAIHTFSLNYIFICTEAICLNKVIRPHDPKVSSPVSSQCSHSIDWLSFLSAMLGARHQESTENVAQSSVVTLQGTCVLQ